MPKTKMTNKEWADVWNTVSPDDTITENDLETGVLLIKTNDALITGVSGTNNDLASIITYLLAKDRALLAAVKEKIEVIESPMGMLVQALQDIVDTKMSKSSKPEKLNGADLDDLIKKILNK